MLAGDNMDGKHILSEYMDSPIWPVLSPTEWMVLEALARNGPLSGYDFHLGGRRQRGNRKALMSSGYWLKVLKRLGPEGFKLICKVGLRGRLKEGTSKRRKNLFWLSDRGLALVLAEGVPAETVLGHAERVYGKNSLEALLVRLRMLLGVEIFRLCHRLILEHGLNADTILTAAGISLLQAAKFRHMKPQDFNRRINQLLEPYPEIREEVKSRIADLKRGVLSLEEE